MQYSDRFIPCRNTAARLNFSLADKDVGPADSSKHSDRDDNMQTYNMLLKSELLGMPPSLASPERGQNGSFSPVTRSETIENSHEDSRLYRCV